MSRMCILQRTFLALLLIDISTVVLKGSVVSLNIVYIFFARLFYSPFLFFLFFLDLFLQQTRKGTTSGQFCCKRDNKAPSTT